VLFDDGGTYLGDVFYDLAMASMARLTLAMASELAPHGVTALALSPGFVRTERVAGSSLATEAQETPLYAGRAVAALACDADVTRHAGRILHVGDLASLYGFTDADGRRPPRYSIAERAADRED
jgi:NAD(P)-dependent dehydrogenase (short-subunit alcohol dehydrogenase family)